MVFLVLVTGLHCGLATIGYTLSEVEEVFLVLVTGLHCGREGRDIYVETAERSSWSS